MAASTTTIRYELVNDLSFDTFKRFAIDTYMKQVKIKSEIPVKNNVPLTESIITSEAAQEAFESKLADFNTERKGNIRVSFNGLPLTEEQLKKFENQSN